MTGIFKSSFLEDLIDAGWERMKYEGRMMKWGSLSGAFPSFILAVAPPRRHQTGGARV